MFLSFDFPRGKNRIDNPEKLIADINSFLEENISQSGTRQLFEVILLPPGEGGVSSCSHMSYIFSLQNPKDYQLLVIFFDEENNPIKEYTLVSNLGTDSSLYDRYKNEISFLSFLSFCSLTQISFKLAEKSFSIAIPVDDSAPNTKEIKNYISLILSNSSKKQ